VILVLALAALVAGPLATGLIMRAGCATPQAIAFGVLIQVGCAMGVFLAWIANETRGRP
jgi:hypothetical protein